MLHNFNKMLLFQQIMCPQNCLYTHHGICGICRKGGGPAESILGTQGVCTLSEIKRTGSTHCKQMFYSNTLCKQMFYSNTHC